MNLKEIKFETEKVTSCIICNDSPKISDNNFSMQLGLTNNFGITKCKKCGLRWLNPRPTESAYLELYTNNFYFGGKHSVESFDVIGKNRKYYFGRRIANIERFFKKKKKLKILDVGSATGEFVLEALKRKHSAIGIEISDDARMKANKKYKLDLLNATIEDIKTNNRFDVIHLNHVLEHLPNPKESLILCHELLKPKGLIVLEVPHQIHNDMDRAKKLLGIGIRKGFSPYSLHHTYFFTPNSLKTLLEKCNYEVASLKTQNPNHTPLAPFNFKNLVLRIYLHIVDFIHHGGNIIEIYGVRKN